MGELPHPDIIDLQRAERGFPIGRKVRYYPVLPHTPVVTPPPREAQVRSAPWILGHGQIVVKITGQAGGASIFHLEGAE